MEREQRYHEEKLIGLLRDDSEYAFQLVYDHYRNRIYKLAMLYLKSPVLAQEVVQDVFLKLWFNRKNLRPGTSLLPWLLTVAKNHLINQLKSVAHKWVTVSIPQNDFGEVVSGAADPVFDSIKFKEYQQHLDNAVTNLSENQRKVFLSIRDDGLTHAQISEKLKMSPLTVKTHMARAIQSIKSYLKTHNLLFAIIFFQNFL